MEIFPAIDIIGGQVVRLKEGDYNQVSVYGDDPLAMANRFVEQGAKNLHVVDLDGAKEGTTVNFSVIQRLRKETGLFIEVGGGIRDEARIASYLELGVDRVILGTIAVKNYPFVEEMVRKYGDKIAVGVDARNEKVAVSGWLDVTEMDAIDFCVRLRDSGVKTVIFTDIAKDGMLSGANLALYKRLSAIQDLSIMASGGVTTLDDIKALRDMNLYGAIVGKALYTGHLSLGEVLATAPAIAPARTGEGGAQ
ncbi:MAG: 1-(5-phosphoribosyl)-5-[(5-phosphoribosylamino)methylideneamino]imidazole-4-carboxamide isomerase [Clostridiales bacterium]|nr:1-(5-phosphoribosyl)-5-[(5-phosphoribosylamino)methylideneamino]imidazole-4-carboxamide isomerase [Clostridiales bacterium]